MQFITIGSLNKCWLGLPLVRQTALDFDRDVLFQLGSGVFIEFSLNIKQNQLLLQYYEHQLT